MKTFTYLFDVPEDGGCTTLVPGTHRLPGGPRETLRCRFAGAAHDFGLAAAGAAEQGSAGEVVPMPASSMPNQLPMAVEGGTVFLFDNAVWHTVRALTHADLRLSLLRGLLGPSGIVPSD